MSEPPLDVVVVGAGFAGLYQLHKLRELGFSARLIEAGQGVGGTWFWNRYPGARCDVESMSYSYTFSPELDQEWTWSEKYSTQPEILAYLNHVAERFDLLRDITFDTRVLGARYDEQRRRWAVSTDTGEAIDAQFVVFATGCLSAAKVPEIAGYETFAGEVYNTSSWPAGGVDFTGKRVAVIGTGSSGIQIIPLVAEQAASLAVFQRTPSFSIPAQNRPLTEDEVSDRKRSYPEWRAAQRSSSYGVPVEPAMLSALEVDEDVRRATYQRGWDDGSAAGVVAAYTDIVTDLAANTTAADFVRSKIHEIVQDPMTADALTPTGFAIGTKRMCLDTGYYATFNRPDVMLVDLAATPIDAITEQGIRTSAQLYEFDAIVYATGFDAMTGAMTAVNPVGRAGTMLRDAWANGPRSYLGVAVSDFPNLFTVTGPLSPSVLSNVVVSIEQHVEWISDCLAHLRTHNLDEIEALAPAEQAWGEHVAEVAAYTLYPTARSWYTGANVAGKPEGFMVYLGGVGAFREKCDAVAAAGYEGFRTAGRTTAVAAPVLVEAQ